MYHNLMQHLFPLRFENSSLVWVPLVILSILCDQLTKYLVAHYFHLGMSVDIFPGFNLVLVHNYGAAFGFLNQGETWQVFLLIGIALLATVIFIGWLARLPREQSLEGVGIALILGGAIGNLIDRFCHGFVIDFLDVYIASYHWPAFNFADSFICIGAGCVILQLLRRQK